MQIAEMIFKILNVIALRPMIRKIVEVAKIFAIRLDPICESCCHQRIVAHLWGVREDIFFVERLSSAARFCATAGTIC